jgi:hypothetical protein
VWKRREKTTQLSDSCCCLALESQNVSGEFLSFNRKLEVLKLAMGNEKIPLLAHAFIKISHKVSDLVILKN